MPIVIQPGVGEWRHGIFDCCGSCTDCLCACLCPNCYAFCAAQDAGEGTCTALLNCLFFPLFLCCLRSNVRGQRGIEGGMINDAICAWCCPCCAVIQMRREFND